ncbi:MAG: ATP-binding protein [Pseudomonadota bacterium]
MIKRLFKPAIFLINRLSYAMKIFLFGSISIISLAIVIFSLYQNLNKIVVQSNLQLQASSHITATLRMIQLVQQQRALSTAVIGGNKQFAKQLSAKIQIADVQFKFLISNLDPYLSNYVQRRNYNYFWQQLKTQSGTLSSEENFSIHTDFIYQLHRLLLEYGDHYEWSTTTELSSYYLFNIVLSSIPIITETMGQIRAAVMSIAAKNHTSKQEKLELIKLEHELKLSIDELIINFNKASYYAPYSIGNIRKIKYQLLSAKQQIESIIETDILSEQYILQADNIYEIFTNYIDNSYYSLYQLLIPDLIEIINQRRQQANNQIYRIIGTALGMLLILIYLFFGFYFSVTHSFRRIKQVLNAYAKGKFDQQINIDTADEMNNISQSMNAMAQSLSGMRNQLEDEKLRFKMLFEKSGDALALIENNTFCVCNENIVKMLGYDIKSMLQIHLGSFSPVLQPDGENSIQKANRMMAICLHDGSNFFEWMYRRKNGEKFWSNILLTRLEYQGKEIIHAVIRDIDSQKQLQHDNEQIKDEAIRANQAKSKFLANMSHELRTPMHGILSYAQMGFKRIDKVPTEKLKRYFENIETSAKRLMLLINNLLDLSKLQGSKIELQLSQCNIEEMIASCSTEMHAKLKERNLSLVIDKSTAPIFLVCDKLLINQVLTNLLSNAIKYSPDHGKITFQCQIIENNMLKIKVQDQGCGINIENIHSIFENFVQDASLEAGTGMGSTGLGLAICKEIISVHQGKIWAEHNDNDKIGGILCFIIPLNE